MVKIDGLDAAIKLLEQIYQYNPGAARHWLVQALMAKSEVVTSEDELLELYERILKLDTNHTIALEKQNTILMKRQAKEAANLAIEAKRLEENQHDYFGALEILKQLTTNFSRHGNWDDEISRLEKKCGVTEIYTEAETALSNNDIELAKGKLIEVITLEPEHEQALEYLLRITKGVDVSELQNKINIDDKETIKMNQTLVLLRKSFNRFLGFQVAGILLWGMGYAITVLIGVNNGIYLGYISESPYLALRSTDTTMTINSDSYTSITVGILVTLSGIILLISNLIIQLARYFRQDSIEINNDGSQSKTPLELLRNSD